MTVSPDVIIHGSPFSLKCSIDSDYENDQGFVRWSIGTTSVIYTYHRNSDNDLGCDSLVHGREVSVDDEKNGNYILHINSAVLYKDANNYTCKEEYALISGTVAVNVQSASKWSIYILYS